ncbi:hypothetical protein MRX96_001646 [Rhipicephalus microplus]
MVAMALSSSHDRQCLESAVICGKGQDPENVHNVFCGLKDGHARSEAFAAYFAITTGMTMFSEEFVLAEYSDDVSWHAKFCDRMSLKSHGLWDLSSAMALTNAHLDATVRIAFDAVYIAVASDVGELFANYSDAARLRKFIKSIRLILPKDITHPYASIMPT